MSETPDSHDGNTLTLTAPSGASQSECLTSAEALALAQFAKRVGWFEFTSHALDDDEAHLMKQAIDKMQDLLTRSGYAPR
jgi:hypothetical protein